LWRDTFHAKLHASILKSKLLYFNKHMKKELVLLLIFGIASRIVAMMQDSS
jgi:hypothetical protein